MKGCESTSKWSLLNKYPYKNQIYSFILIVFMWKLFNLVTDFLALVFFYLYCTLLQLYGLKLSYTSGLYPDSFQSQCRD